MQGVQIITSAHQLKKIEKEIFHAMDEALHVHVLLQGHQCQGVSENYEIISKNLHPSIKCLYISKNLIEEFRALDLVLRSNSYKGLDFFCPACPVDTPPDF